MIKIKDIKEALKTLSKLNIKQPKFKITKVENLEDATHWIPTRDENIESQNISYKEVGITIGKKYRLLYDKFEDEDCIIDDNGCLSLIYLCHCGDLVKMEEVR